MSVKARIQVTLDIEIEESFGTGETMAYISNQVRNHSLPKALRDGLWVLGEDRPDKKENFLGPKSKAKIVETGKVEFIVVEG